jgi:hypothetical protein
MMNLWFRFFVMGFVMSGVRSEGKFSVDLDLPSSEKSAGEKVVGDIVIHLGKQRAG